MEGEEVNEESQMIMKILTGQDMNIIRYVIMSLVKRRFIGAGVSLTEEG
jgi:hypothetical protein